jgi:excisionase family DNA binding protein
MGEELLTTSQVAKRLSVSKSTVLRYVREGHLPGTIRLPSGYLRIPRSAVEALVRRGREDIDQDRR